MKYVFNDPKPYKHQEEALRKTLTQGHMALWCEMRTGKSRVAIDAACCWHLMEDITKVLIVCPLNSMGIWEDEILKWAPPDILKKMDFRVINYEMVYDRATFHDHRGKRRWFAISNDELLYWGPQVLIIDESHRASNYKSVTHQKLYELRRETVKHVLELTGTEGKPEKVFGQFRLLEDSVFGNSIKSFDAHFTIRHYKYKSKIKGYRNEEEYYSKIEPWIYKKREEECWDIPPQRDQIVPVQLEESYDIYAEMAYEAATFIGGDEYTAPQAVTKMLRLAQITGGFLNNETKRKRVGREKERVFKDWLVQLQENERDKVVVFTRFIPDLIVCSRVAQSLGFQVLPFHGKLTRQQKERRRWKFEETNRPTVFVAQVASGRESLDLAVASDVGYYSLPQSLIHFKQSKARVRGKRQKNRITYNYFLGRGTIDELIYLSLQQEEDLINMLHKHPHLLLRGQRKEMVAA